ncbi:MAG TPA: PxKF domain-containing protein [Candidatus Polarisedimenticolia bacterium]|nr:PxKF domain-containing protein [Candidatus Polarisedimenticolia bacterium]
MKLGWSGSVLYLLVTLVLAALAAPQAFAQGITFPAGSLNSMKVCNPLLDEGCPPGFVITANGDAQSVLNTSEQNVLRLTPAVGHQRGSAWFNTKQPVAGGFTTSFQFQTSEGSLPPADGIAFVIQNNSLSALGRDGGSIGYADGGGDCDGEPCDTGGGIKNSLAVEFDTFDNGGATGDPNANHIAVQSCGIGKEGPRANSPGHTTENTFGFPNCLIGDIGNPETTMSDGSVHTVVIDYTPPTCGECPGALVVNLDGAVVSTVSVTIPDLLDLTDGSKAWVGLTSATGDAFENHDILSWTFTPHTTSEIEQPIPDGGQTNLFNFGSHNLKVTYPAGFTNPGGTIMEVQAQTISPADFATLISGGSFSGAQCTVYDGTGGNCVIYQVICEDPDTDLDTPCPTEGSPTIDVSTSYDLVSPQTTVDNPGFLRADPAFGGTNPVSNIISSFSQTRIDPTSSGRTTHFSQLVAVSLPADAPTPLPDISVSLSPTAGVYLLNQSVTAIYSCTPPAGAPSLNITSCTAAVSGPISNPNVANNTAVPTGATGAYTLTVTALDGLGRTATKPLSYNVQYDFAGFFQPVDNLPTLNGAKAGSAIPVKFSLAGNQGLNIFATGYPVSVQIACSSTAPIDDITQTVTAGGSSLQYDASSRQYIYVWKTLSSWTGTCRQLIVKLADGASRAANFKFK